MQIYTEMELTYKMHLLLNQATMMMIIMMMTINTMINSTYLIDNKNTKKNTNTNIDIDIGIKKNKKKKKNIKQEEERMREEIQTLQQKQEMFKPK